MASGLSNYLAQALLNGIYGGSAFSLPGTVYVALITDTNTAIQRSAGTVTEVSGSSYARVAVTNNATNFPAASMISNVATKSNGTAITFPTPTGAQGTATAFYVYDAGTSGNPLWWGDLTTPTPIVSGNVVTFPIGLFVFTLG